MSPQMAEPATAAPTPRASDVETGRAIRFAVYLTGGLVTLAFAVTELATSLGEVLNCAYQTTLCGGGLSSGLDLEVAPELGAGVFLAAVSVVLFVLARRVR